jgi:hypothetical protein
LKETPRLNVEQIHQDKHILDIELQSLLKNHNQVLSDVIKYFDNYFSLLERIKGYDYIQRNLEIERNFESICNKHKHFFIAEIDLEDFLCPEELDVLSIYNNYRIRMEDIERQKNDMTNDIAVIFYADILGRFSDYFYQMQQIIPVLLKSTLKKNKVYFDELVQYIAENNKENSDEQKQVIQCPFTIEAEELFHHLQSKIPPKNLIHFSYVYNAMLELKCIPVDNNTKENYFRWVNQIYNNEFNGKIKFHCNTSSIDILDNFCIHINDFKAKKIK